MFKRFIRSLDGIGVATFVLGILTLLLAGAAVYVSYRLGSYALVVVSVLAGLSAVAKFINIASLGSIYRQKDGKNKELYLANKEHLDKRFRDMFDYDPDSSEDEGEQQ